MTTHCSVLTWGILWADDPDRLQFKSSPPPKKKRIPKIVYQDLVTKHHYHLHHHQEQEGMKWYIQHCIYMGKTFLKVIMINLTAIGLSI